MRFKRSVPLFISLAVLILPSCSSRDRERDKMDAIQTSFRDAASVSFDAGITADYGQRLFDFAVSYSGSASAGSLTVTAPESIAGVTVTLSEGAATLKFNGASIYTGEILPDGLTPVDALPLLLSCWSDGLVTETVREKWNDADCLAALFRIDDRVNARTWFSGDDDLPVRAEVDLDGMSVITCDFYNMKVE